MPNELWRRVKTASSPEFEVIVGFFYSFRTIGLSLRIQMGYGLAPLLHARNGVLILINLMALRAKLIHLMNWDRSDVFPKDISVALCFLRVLCVPRLALLAIVNVPAKTAFQRQGSDEDMRQRQRTGDSRHLLRHSGYHI